MGSLFGPVIGANCLSGAGRIFIGRSRILGADQGPLLLLICCSSAAASTGCGSFPVAETCSVSRTVAAVRGIVATDHVSLRCRTRRVARHHRTERAGKTTLISQLTGPLLPHAGNHSFGGSEHHLTLPAYRAARLGWRARFRITSLLLDFTALDNVALAAGQAHDGHSFHFWGNARKVTTFVKRRRQRSIGSGWGTRRYRGFTIEPRRAARTRARGGARHEAQYCCSTSDGRTCITESARMVKICWQELRREVSFVLVEHDMDAVLRSPTASASGLWAHHRLRPALRSSPERRGQARVSRRSAPR